MKHEMKAWRRARCLAVRLGQDSSGIAAVEFAFILPLMLVLFFGVVEITNGVAAYRDVSITAHTLSDLTSQSSVVQDSDLQNIFCASAATMYPYAQPPCPPIPTTVTQSIAELWVNSSLQARVQWAVNSDGSAGTTPGTVVPIPTSLQVANTYVIYSSASYLYKPTIGYVMNKAGVTLSDFAYTRPRTYQCVLHYATAPNPLPNPLPACPTN